MCFKIRQSATAAHMHASTDRSACLDEPDTDELLGNGRLAVARLDHLVSQVASVGVLHHDAELVVARVKIAHFNNVSVLQVHHDPNFLNLEVIFPQVVHNLRTRTRTVRVQTPMCERVALSRMVPRRVWASRSAP
jgi:hypothetical protein